MADSKYGRLFTQDDVLAIVAGVLLAEVTKEDVSPEGAEALLADIVEGLDRIGRLRFERDEPLFLLRGQDICALDGVEAYLAECEKPHADTGDPWTAQEHRDAVGEAQRVFKEWQREHPDRVKVPDAACLMPPEQRLTPAQYRALEEIEAGRVSWSRHKARYVSAVRPPATRFDVIERVLDLGLAEALRTPMLTDKGRKALAQHRSQS